MTRFLKKIAIAIALLANAGSSNLVSNPQLACKTQTSVVEITLTIDATKYEVLNDAAVTKVNNQACSMTITPATTDIALTIPLSCLGGTDSTFGTTQWVSSDTLLVGFKPKADTANVLVEQVSLDFECKFVDNKKVGAQLGPVSLDTNTLQKQVSTSDFDFELKFYNAQGQVIDGSSTVQSGTPIRAAIKPKDAANQPNNQAFEYSSGKYVFLPTKCEFGVGADGTDITTDVLGFTFKAGKSVTLFDDDTNNIVRFANNNKDLAAHISQSTVFDQATTTWNVNFKSFVFHDEISKTYAILCEVNTCDQGKSDSKCQTFKNTIAGNSDANDFWTWNSANDLLT